MPPEEKELKELIKKVLIEELPLFLKTDKMTLEKHLQILNARNIQVGKGTGTKIGTETTQKLSVYGVTPVVQAGAISSPAATTGALKTAVDAIRVALTNFGITA